jgi:ribonuclease BN (tRNA processing enzyme)
MELTTLGGSAAGPSPGQGCSGYLLQSGRTRIVLDLGPGTLPELRKHVDIRELDGVIISHLHLDHFLDLLALRFALAYNPIPARRPVAVWLPPGGLRHFERLAVALTTSGNPGKYFSMFDLCEFDPEEVLSVGGLRLRFHPTVHFVPCWAIRVSNGEDGDLLYTADTGPTARLAPFGEGSFILVAEGTEGGAKDEGIASRGHLTPAEAGRLGRDIGARMLVLTHVWAEHDPSAAMQKASEAFGGPVTLAAPGLSIRWGAAQD